MPHRLLEHGDLRVHFEGTGVQRRATRLVEGEDAVAYALRVEGGAIVLDAE